MDDQEKAAETPTLSVVRGHRVELSNGGSVAVGRLDPILPCNDEGFVDVMVCITSASGGLTVFGLSAEAAEALFSPQPAGAEPWELELKKPFKSAAPYRFQAEFTTEWRLVKTDNAEPPETAA